MQGKSSGKNLFFLFFLLNIIIEYSCSIRDNILFGEPYRPKRYDKIIESCALKADIDLMPNGDLTEIGERGLSISGGQRQRLCIARALYSSANVIILVFIVFRIYIQPTTKCFVTFYFPFNNRMMLFHR